MRRFLTAFSVALLLASPAFAQSPSAPPAPVTDVSKASSGIYQLDKSHATLVFNISHVGFSIYRGRFNDFDANINLDPKKPEASAVDVTVNMASVDTHNPKLEDELKSDKFFNVAKFPTATFKSRQITRSGVDSGTMAGDLTFMGVTKPVTLNVTFHGYGPGPFNKKEVMGFGATTTIRRSDFGMGAYVPMVGDEVRLEIEAEFDYSGASPILPSAAAPSTLVVTPPAAPASAPLVPGAPGTTTTTTTIVTHPPVEPTVTPPAVPAPASSVPGSNKPVSGK